MAGEILSLAIADIEIGTRVGFYHSYHAAGLALAMGAGGQHNPIHVALNDASAVRPWKLVAGRHRIGAAELLGWSHIDAIQVAGAGEDARRLRAMELSENLDHRNPRPIERAIFIDARARLEEEIDYPGHAGEARQARGARLRWHASATMSEASEWIERTARSLGISERTLRRYRAIHGAIVEPFPQFAEALNSHQLGESFIAMMRLAQIRHEATRRKVIETILTNPDVATVDAAMVSAGVSTSKGGRMPERDRAHAAFLTGWTAMPLTQQRAAAPAFARDLKPSVAEIMAENLRPEAAQRMLAVLKKREPC